MSNGVIVADVCLFVFVCLGLFHRFRVMAIEDRATLDRFMVPLFITLSFFYVAAFSILRTDQSGGGADLFAYNGYIIGGLVSGGLLGAMMGIWHVRIAKSLIQNYLE